MSESIEILERLAVRLDDRFHQLAPMIMQELVQELGGLRFTFPNLATIHRMERNRQICNEFKGNNTVELGLRHKMHPSQIRRIVNKGRPGCE